MNYTIAISASPECQGNRTALLFCRALLEKGHSIDRVFFFQEGVLTGNRLAVSPQDEESLYEEWRKLGEESSLELVVCVSAALRRGVVDESEAKRYELPAHNLEAPFVIGGLGQLVDGMIGSDRFIHFQGQA